MGQSNADEDTPSIGDLDTAERFGQRVALISRRCKDGIAFETERTTEDFRKLNLERSLVLYQFRAPALNTAIPKIFFLFVRLQK